MPACIRLDIGREIAYLTLHEKRVALAEIVRSTGGTWRGHSLAGVGKLEAIRIDCELAGHGATARANLALAQFLEKFAPEDLKASETFTRGSLC